MNTTVLLISNMIGIENCARSLSNQLACEVDSASGRKEAIAAIKNHPYTVVVIDEAFSDADPRAAELIWRYTGLAIPITINFALSGTARLGRDIRAAMTRRDQEQSLAMRAAASTIESRLKATMTGLLLQSQLALAEPSLTSDVATKLRMVVELAGSLRTQLEQAQA